MNLILRKLISLSVLKTFEEIGNSLYKTVTRLNRNETIFGVRNNLFGQFQKFTLVNHTIHGIFEV
jgi:hypothetical protein